MDTLLIVLAIVVIGVIVLALVGLWLLKKQRKKRQLRESLGPEYEQTVERTGSQKEADKELQARQKRIQEMHIKNLSSKQKKQFSSDWRRAQAEFVDKPKEAIIEADFLVMKIMEARGYPVTDFDQRAADISVKHPTVVRDFRAAQSIVEKHRKQGASTEELRQAMTHYHSLVDDLLGTSTKAR